MSHALRSEWTTDGGVAESGVWDTAKLLDRVLSDRWPIRGHTRTGSTSLVEGPTALLWAGEVRHRFFKRNERDGM